jgi:general secretion pathway protein C
MVMAAGKDFALSIRGGLTATAEFVGLSALGVSLAALMWTVAAPKGAVAAPAADEVSGSDRSGALAVRLSSIEDPFARGGTVAAASAAEASGFVLHATRMMKDGYGTAILSPSGGQQGAYAVGEEIAPGVMLATVGADHVEIDVGGRRMRLTFPGAGAAPALQMAGSLPADYSAAAKSATVPSVSSSTLGGLPLQPVSRNGQPAGFEVMPHANGGVLAAAGLKPGDILISINGVSATSADLSAYRAQLLSGQSVEIRFERDGQILTARLGN